jgi:hypothetical protein
MKVTSNNFKLSKNRHINKMPKQKFATPAKVLVGLFPGFVLVAIKAPGKAARAASKHIIAYV